MEPRCLGAATEAARDVGTEPAPGGAPVDRLLRVLAALGLALSALTPAAAAQETGAVGGRVVDHATGEAISGVLVTLEGVDPTLTSEDGSFVFLEVPVGPRALRLEHLAYGEHARSVLVEADGELVLRVAMSTQAIELSPLLVETLSELEQRRISSGNSITEITQPEIDRAARAGLDLAQLLQSGMPGVDVRPGFGGHMCVQYRAIRSDNDRGDCDGVSVMLDGVPIADPGYVYTSIPLNDIERVEVLSPGQAGVRYGMRSGQGVLLIETKRAEAARRSDLSRLMTGLDWTGEQEPYPWLKVFGSALLANAVGVGVGLLLSDRCFWTPEASAFALRTRCAGAATAGAGIVSVVLPATGGSLAARWSGSTDRSRGRLVPSMVTSGMILTGGYLLLIGGEGQRSQTAGTVVLALGVPLALTLSDRVFRVLR